MAADFRSQRLAESGIKPITFDVLPPDRPCKANKRHAALCGTCARLPLLGDMHAKPAAYFDRDGDSQCRNLIDGEVHVATIHPEQGIAQTVEVGGANVRHPTYEGAPEA